MDLSNVFGVNVEDEFLRWFRGAYTEGFAKRYPGKGMTFVVLDPDKGLSLFDSWETPLQYAMFTLHMGDEAVATAPDGTLENVEGKLRFVLRTLGRDSVEAEDALSHMVRPGDFAWEGAGEDDGFIAGVSGLAKQQDTLERRHCIAMLKAILAAVDKLAITKADKLRREPGCPLGTKYLNGINVAEEWAALLKDEGLPQPVPA